MRRVLASAEAGNTAARLAIEIYVHRVRQAIGSMAASIGGMDALVFTAGVGEHAASIRAAVCDRLGFLGVQMAPERNVAAHSDALISSDTSRVAILIITCCEDLSMLSEVRQVLARSAGLAQVTSFSTHQEP
jgi:acetate kinase